jgi:hypothetical protein
LGKLVVQDWKRPSQRVVRNVPEVHEQGGNACPMSPPPIAVRERAREERFQAVWNQQLDAAFADVAHYYDWANNVASLGLWGWFLSVFMSTMDVRLDCRQLLRSRDATVRLPSPAG